MKHKIGKALVVGAGVSGIRSALDLAETGYGVTLIDREPHMGGILSQLDRQFPGNHCGMCKMLPLVERDTAAQFCLRKGLYHENIDLRLSTELASIEGEPGKFTVRLHQKSTGVDPDRCTGCDACTPVCPVQVPDEFNGGLSLRKAIYLPVPHAIPNAYVIDPAACNRCGACQQVCPTDAIALIDDQRRHFRVLVVDDELIVRDSLKEWLEEEHFGVAMAASGSEALEMLADGGYHLMLTDIKMPGMDGVTLLQKAQAAHPDLCVLMMTAYATVDSAVEAMKIGALDYLIKPFDPEIMIPKIVAVYQQWDTHRDVALEVGAIVVCAGTGYFDPAQGKDAYGYASTPGVVTNLEFERILSGTGPSGGRLLRPRDRKPLRKIAWLQCVGSRDMQSQADFCSSICCMAAIREALLAKVCQNDLETVIFHMDMRTVGKSYQRYRERAETEAGVRFERGRIHSIDGNDTSADLTIRWVDANGQVRTETFDMAILAVGQRPAEGTAAMAEMAGIDLNPWGFVSTIPFSGTRTRREGVLAGGSVSGLKDIGDSLIYASAAAANASRIIHIAGGGLAEQTPDNAHRDVSREPASIRVALCTCGRRLADQVDLSAVKAALFDDPDVQAVETMNHLCTVEGWDLLTQQMAAHTPNRIVIGACHPYLFLKKLRRLGRHTGLDPALMDVVDLGLTGREGILSKASTASHPPVGISEKIIARLGMAVSRLRQRDPTPTATTPICQRALVVGAGIAGMTAALCIADHGYPVDLVEQAPVMGGNLGWLERTLEGDRPGNLLAATTKKVENHPQIQVHLQSRVVGGFGEVGNFHTTLESHDKGAYSLEHGVAILATGGREAATDLYKCGQHPAVVTQKQMEEKLATGGIDPQKLTSVVMIQCVGSREEPRNYCSRVCCCAALKHALFLKQHNPRICVYILYRDIMTYGFSETFYTQARRSGVIFIPYDLQSKPEVLPQAKNRPDLQVRTFDPLLARPVVIDADLLVLATGIVPQLPPALARWFGADLDPDGFFSEADAKWRPVDALKEGVFACGLAHSPRPITEAIATAGAAAQRALRILCREVMPAGKLTSQVRHALCSLCLQCIETCPFSARSLDLEANRVRVNPAMCQGCGICATACPNGASILKGFNGQQMLAVIDAALE